jgi:hypothetical protein
LLLLFGEGSELWGIELKAIIVLAVVTVPPLLRVKQQYGKAKEA